MKLITAQTLALGAACLLNSGAQGQRPGPSARRDVEQGAEVARLVEQQIGLYSQPTTEAYLRQVGERLVAVVKDPRWQFRFDIVDQSEPNAFAIPGGGIYVSRGLLALLNREDELAGVLAHEMAHVLRAHVKDRILGNSVLSLLVSASPGAGPLQQGLRELARQFLHCAYSHEQELEADAVGIKLMRAAGYDPRGAIRVLELLQSCAGKELDADHYFSSHPPFALRLQRIAGLVPR